MWLWSSREQWCMASASWTFCTGFNRKFHVKWLVIPWPLSTLIPEVVTFRLGTRRKWLTYRDSMTFKHVSCFVVSWMWRSCQKRFSYPEAYENAGDLRNELGQVAQNDFHWCCRCNKWNTTEKLSMNGKIWILFTHLVYPMICLVNVLIFISKPTVFWRYLIPVLFSQSFWAQVSTSPDLFRGNTRETSKWG